MNNYSLQEEELIERLNWYIRLRWIAVLGVFITILFVSKFLQIPLHTTPLYRVAFIIAGYNLLFFFSAKKILKEKKPGEVLKKTNLFANLQISVDLFALALLIHFSGGVENPFVFYFIFHMIVAGIILTRRAAYLQATLATALFGGLVGLEYYGLIPHICIDGFIKEDLCHDKIYVLAIFLVFASTIYISVTMATSVSKRLRQRQQELAEANLKLIEQDRLKSEYVSYVLRVAHDIREDLSAIQGCLKLITGGFVGPVEGKQDQLIRRAEKRTLTLLDFVKDVLSLASLKPVRDLEMKPTSLPIIIREAVENMYIHSERTRVKLSLELPEDLPEVNINQAQIKELVINLVTNAIKYTTPGGMVRIKATAEDKGVRVAVSDTGIGVKPEDKEQIFKEFYRADNAKKAELDGTGLGLTIAHQIVTSHGGDIWVESPGEHQGSTFFFTLPKY